MNERCQLGGMNKVYAYPTGTVQTQIPHSFYLGRTLQNELTSLWTWADSLRKIRFYVYSFFKSSLKSTAAKTPHTTTKTAQLIVLKFKMPYSCIKTTEKSIAHAV